MNLEPVRLLQNLFQKIPGSFTLGIVEELLIGAPFDDAPKIHEDYFIGDFTGEAHFMGDTEHRHPLFGQIDHDIQNFFDHIGTFQKKARLSINSFSW